MSSIDIVVLTPNGRRQKVHCTPDTSILQILEEVCQKQGFEPSGFDLKHHKHILDLANTIRFSNLPNKATLEMVETDNKRKEFNVTIGLSLEDGERRTAEFSPNTSLYDLLMSLASQELESMSRPSILYMRQEVTGLAALKEKTLKHLGLIGGRAILRLLNKAEETMQANVSAVYRRIEPQKQPEDSNFKPETGNGAMTSTDTYNPMPGPSEIHKTNTKKVDFLDTIKVEKKRLQNKVCSNTQNVILENEEEMEKEVTEKQLFDKIEQDESPSSSRESSSIKDNLERRLMIEEEVTFVGTRKAVVFKQPENKMDDLVDLPDDFYDLTIDEVRKLYNDLQQQRLQLENMPLITSSKREELLEESQQQKFGNYKNAVVRIQFPDHFVLQGVFSPTDTIEDIFNFVKGHLNNPEKLFHLFSTPLKETLDPNLTLLKARYVPCVHLHFKWVQEDSDGPYLKEDVYSKETPSDAARILASKYRAPTRRKIEDASSETSCAPSSSKNSKLPKWFKL